MNFLQTVQASTGSDSAAPGLVSAGLFDEASVDQKSLAALLAQLPPMAIETAASFQQPSLNGNVSTPSPSSSSAQGASTSASGSKTNALSPQNITNGINTSPDTPNRKASIIGKGKGDLKIIYLIHGLFFLEVCLVMIEYLLCRRCCCYEQNNQSNT